MEVGCHFLCQVKRNCRKLWESIALYTALSHPIASCEYYDNSHGYQVNRRIELYDNQADIPFGWNGIQRLVKVRRWGYRAEEFFDERAFYVLSKPIDSAAVVANAIQGHWSVENNLYWIKDVNLGEDDMTLTDPGMATILAYLNNVAINILARAGRKPSKDTFAKISNKVNELIKLFNST